ncbi:tyrosine-type recombinase/integrase [Alkalinema pantanalense CENA528]|uniref:tyrosine-type recombinase/integrase n=1 Tax=Alkalinema pantanalense TaxID=1620705 RepID=UPI003D6F850A
MGPDATGKTEPRDRAVLAVLSHGLRAEEVVNLNLDDFDGIRLTIRMAKDDSTGTVPLGRDARDCLTQYISDRRKIEPSEPDAPMFLAYGRNRKGQRLGYQGIYYLVKALGQRAAKQAQWLLEQRQLQEEVNAEELNFWQHLSEVELEEIRRLEAVHPHQLRHTFATGLLLRGMDSFHARTLTRHKSESSFKRYAKRAMMVAAEQAFFRALGEEAPTSMT